VRVLLVKTSSMGDILHSFSAVEDAYQRLPNVSFDWVVEEGFADMPSWHPAVKTVIPVALRRWRKTGWSSLLSAEGLRMLRDLRAKEYDVIIDAQGLWKSALWTRLARGRLRCGWDKDSIREKGAHLFYQRRCCVSPQKHAITRLRLLMAHSLGYSLEGEALQQLSWGLKVAVSTAPKKDVFFIHVHSTVWRSKAWPLSYWRDLAGRVVDRGYRVCVPSGSAAEEEKASRIVEGLEEGQRELFPPGSLTLLKERMQRTAVAAVSLDTGLGHLAAALGVPTIGLYGPTDPEQIGLQGRTIYWVHGEADCMPCSLKHCRVKEGDAACYKPSMVEEVWTILKTIL
jgi:heptosyltransferase I